MLLVVVVIVVALSLLPRGVYTACVVCEPTSISMPALAMVSHLSTHCLVCFKIFSFGLGCTPTGATSTTLLVALPMTLSIESVRKPTAVHRWKRRRTELVPGKNLRPQRHVDAVCSWWRRRPRRRGTSGSWSWSAPTSVHTQLPRPASARPRRAHA